MTQVTISPFASDRAGALALATRAAEVGLTGVALGDGVTANPAYPVWSGGLDPFVELAWLCGAVDFESYAVSALILPARDPRIVARQAVTLHAVTGGRAVLAVCAGRWEHDARAMGYALGDRAALFDEGIDAIAALFAGETSFDGPTWSWCSDRPLTPTHVSEEPELVLAGGRPTMHRALARGLAFEPPRLLPEDMRPLAEEFLGAGGKRLNVRIRMTAVPVPDDWPSSDPVVTGDGDTLAEAIDAYAELGVTTVSVVPGFDGPSAMATVDALGVAIADLGIDRPVTCVSPT